RDRSQLCEHPIPGGVGGEQPLKCGRVNYALLKTLQKLRSRSRSCVGKRYYTLTDRGQLAGTEIVCKFRHHPSLSTVRAKGASRSSLLLVTALSVPSADRRLALLEGQICGFDKTLCACVCRWRCRCDRAYEESRVAISVNIIREMVARVVRNRPLSVKSKQLLAVCFCLLLSLPSAIEGRKVAVSRVTKPTAHRGYANADIAKLSYSPSHSAPAPAPRPIAPSYSAPPPQPPQYHGGGQPSYGWNVPGGHPAPGAASGGVYPGAAAAGAAGTGLVAGNVYRSHGHNATAGGFGGGLAHSPPGAYPAYPGHPAQGFPGAPVQHPGGGFPAQGYQPQPGGGYVQQQPGAGFPHQPSYAPGGHYDQGQQGHYQGHPGQTAVHHYEQPASGGSGIGTILGAGAAGLAAGVGGAALYDALKPKESKEEAPATTAATTTTAAAAGPASETPAPVPANPNGDAPLAPMPPANPNGEAPLAPMPPANANGDAPLAPMPTEGTPLATVPPAAAGVTEAESTSTTTGATSSSENPLGMAPLAPMPDATSGAPVDQASGADVAVRNSALNVQPDLSASMAEPASGDAPGAVRLSGALSIAALLPLVVKYLRV
ncbi:translation initiation factor IF-2-like, partial [Anopheles nili]|uniref:translation initiation factor IF-2-like n=1 Tax=Anopheles nili TaxID=185578 RepID=UPI00237A9245